MNLLELGATVYVIAALYYMFMTRNIGTPFKDALQDYPNLMKIRNDSKRVSY